MANSENKDFLKRCIGVIRSNLTVFFVLFCIAAAAITMAVTGITTEDLLAYTPSNPTLAAVILLLLFAAKGFCAVVLYDVLVMAAGRMFSLPSAFLLCASGTAICVQIPYWMGRMSGGLTPENFREKHPRLASLFGIGEEDCGSQALLCVFLRCIGFSNEVQGLFFGTSRMPFLPYFIISFLGMIPEMVFFSSLGDSPDVRSPLFWGPIVVSVIGALMAVHLRRVRGHRTPPKQ